MSAEAWSLGKALYHLRIERGIQAKVLASRTGMTRPQISRYEHGLVSPGYPSLVRVLRALGYRLQAAELTQEFCLHLIEYEVEGWERP
jgi:transcriptional regulator with XRE-family HTH domain